jgi:hypothetical protein
MITLELWFSNQIQITCLWVPGLACVPHGWLAAEGSLDFVYIAYLHYLMQLVREAETRAPTRFTSLDMVWFRFFNPKQVEHPDYPPLPPMVVLEDVGVLVNDLMRLAMMGRLP